MSKMSKWKQALTGSLIIGLAADVSANEPPMVVYPPTQEVVEETIRMLEEVQLTPDHHERLKRINLERKRQEALPYENPARPITRTLPVNLDPGVSPPVLRLSKGQLTSIVFSDATGQPWFIEKVALNRNNFSDGSEGAGSGDKGSPTNILTLEPLSVAPFGNATITLRGLSTPVILILTAAQHEVDLRVDAVIPGRNPDSQSSVTVTSMPQLDDVMANFLDGVPPTEARRLKVVGLKNAAAWMYKNNMYVRAEAEANSPAYLAGARSTSGIAVFRYATKYNSVTFTKGGQAITIFIE